MKRRHGFVSNSSSSSFIIALARKPETVEELHSWMFPNGPESIQPYDTAISSQQAAEAAFRDIVEATPMTSEERVKNLDYGTVMAKDGWDHPEFPKSPEFHRFKTPETKREALKAYNAAHKAAAKKVASSMEKENPDKLFFRLEYEDHDPFNCVMEHGDVFRNLTHIRISLH